MVRKTFLALVAAGSLIAAAAALVSGSPTPTAAPKVDAGYGYHMSRNVRRQPLEHCFEEPVQCGLVVW